MKSKHLLPAICILLLSCSSGKRAIQSAEAFAVTTQPGIIAVDEKGNELKPAVNTVLVLYVQTKIKELKCDSAWVDEKPYAVASKNEITQPFEAGFDNNTGEKIILQPAPGYYLFQITLTPGFPKEEERPVTVRIRAWVKGKPVFKNSKPIINLRPFDAQ